MAIYTMELRTIVENDINIFDFNYPIFDEKYRKILEERIISAYYFREIGFETVGRFLHYLKLKMNLIMPYYNKMYESDLMEQRILDNYDVTETYKRKVTSDGTTQATLTSKGDSTSNSNNEQLMLNSDTPAGRVDITTNDYVSNIDKNKGTNSGTVKSNGTETNNATSKNTDNEEWVRTMQGNIGIQTDADAILKYRETLLKIDEMVINELQDLFMQVY